MLKTHNQKKTMNFFYTVDDPAVIKRTFFRTRRAKLRREYFDKFNDLHNLAAALEAEAEYHRQLRDLDEEEAQCDDCGDQGELRLLDDDEARDE